MSDERPYPDSPRAAAQRFRELEVRVQRLEECLQGASCNASNPIEGGGGCKLSLGHDGSHDWGPAPAPAREAQGRTVHCLFAGMTLCGTPLYEGTSLSGVRLDKWLSNVWLSKDDWGPTIQAAIDGEAEHHGHEVPHIDRFCPKCRKAYNENML